MWEKIKQYFWSHKICTVGCSCVVLGASSYPMVPRSQGQMSGGGGQGMYMNLNGDNYPPPPPTSGSDNPQVRKESITHVP